MPTAIFSSTFPMQPYTYLTFYFYFHIALWPQTWTKYVVKFAYIQAPWYIKICRKYFNYWKWAVVSSPCWYLPHAISNCVNNSTTFRYKYYVVLHNN